MKGRFNNRRRARESRIREPHNQTSNIRENKIDEK